jgi:hypothetical protein
MGWNGMTIPMTSRCWRDAKPPAVEFIADS